MKKWTQKIIFVLKKKEKLESWLLVLITVNIHISKILCFFNQLIIFISQIPFNFQVIFMVLFGIQLMHGSPDQILTIVMILSKFSTYRQHLHKIISTPTRLNILFILICDPGMPIIFFARNVTFTNCLSWLHHQPKAFSHVVGGMDNLLNKDNSPMTNAW